MSVATKCPYRYKHQLVNWLVRHKDWQQSDAVKLKKSQLYAIWYKS